MYDDKDGMEERYELTDSPILSSVLLAVLLAVVCVIAGLAAWTGA